MKTQRQITNKDTKTDTNKDTRTDTKTKHKDRHKDRQKKRHRDRHKFKDILRQAQIQRHTKTGRCSRIRTKSPMVAKTDVRTASVRQAV